MQIIMLSMMLSTTIFMFIKHPLSMGIILLIQTINVALMSGLMMLNFWYSYILFLIMVGGMLILFIYMTSIAGNEKFKFSLKISLFTITSLITGLIMIWMMDYSVTSIMQKSSDLWTQSSKLMPNLWMSKFTNYMSNNMLMSMIIYLLTALIAVVKISNINHGPLRQKF